MAHNPHMKEDILKRIQAGDVRMRPRLYFTMQVALLAAIAIAILLISIFLFNFMFFSLRISGHESLLTFGGRGLLLYLRFFPWDWLAIDVLLIVLLVWLVRQFHIGYSRPIVPLLVALLLVSGAFGIALDRATGFNDMLLRDADHDMLPSPIGGIYEHARRPPPPGSGICRCTITAIASSTITAVGPGKSGTTTVYTIHVPKNGSFEATTTGLSVGQTIMIVGTPHGVEIEAFGIHGEPDGDEY